MMIFLLAFLLCIFQANYSMELSSDKSDKENNNIVIEPLISDELLEKGNEFSDSELEPIYQSWREETSSNLGEKASGHYHNIKIRLGLCEKGSATTDNIQPPQDQTIEKIIKELISGTVDPRERINKRGDTILHVLSRYINPLSVKPIL